MGIFSKFREDSVDCAEQRGKHSEIDHCGKDSRSATDVVSTPTSEKGIIESVGELLQHSAHNVKEAVFGHMDIVSDSDVRSLPCALAMEDPFSQSDQVLAAVVEQDVRSASVSDGHEDDAQRKTIVQTVRENLAHSAHIVKDAVLGHMAEPNGDHFAQAMTPVENGDNGGTDDHRKTIMEAMGEIMSHPVQTVKDMIGSHSDVFDSSRTDSSSAIPKQESLGPEPKEREGDSEEVKGLIQTVKEAAHEVKEEMMEVVHEVKEVVMSNDTLPNVQTESITEDSGERPSMELVHTIVHD